MTAAICLNDMERLKFFLELRHFAKKINDSFPFSVSLHHQFINTPEANDNGAEHWPQVTTLLRCAAFLNRVDCLLQLKNKGANMVSGHELASSHVSFPQADSGAYLLANEATKSLADLFDVSTMLRFIHFGDSDFLETLLTNHPNLVNETDGDVNIPIFQFIHLFIHCGRIVGRDSSYQSCEFRRPRMCQGLVATQC
jgi:hypothetical protein